MNRVPTTVIRCSLVEALQSFDCSRKQNSRPSILSHITTTFFYDTVIHIYPVHISNLKISILIFEIHPFTLMHLLHLYF